jgi:hypothetical protein
MCMLRPRLVRELLSQVRPSLGPHLQIVPRIVRLPWVQGLGHPSGSQDKAVHLELRLK